MAGPLPCTLAHLIQPCLEMPELIPKHFIKNVLGRRPANPHGKLTFVVNLCFLSNMIFSVTFMFDDFKSLGLQFCSAQAPTKLREVHWELQLVSFTESFKTFMTLSPYLKHTLHLKTKNSIEDSLCTGSIIMPRAPSLALDPPPF